jgi:hypothetical protein
MRWWVTRPAGSGPAFLARQLAPRLSRQLGQNVVIDNLPGAAGIIGTGDNGAMVFHEARDRSSVCARGLQAGRLHGKLPTDRHGQHVGAGFAEARHRFDALNRRACRTGHASAAPNTWR